MRFNFTEDQEMLKRAVREFLIQEHSVAAARELETDAKGYSVELWTEMAKLGWLGVPFPERYGGVGGNFLDVVIILEEMGRLVFPSPYLSTVVLGGLSILEGGNEIQKREILPKVSRGELIFTLALSESDIRYDPAAIRTLAVFYPTRGVYAISGTKLFVTDAHVADYLLCVARTAEGSHKGEDITIFLVSAGNSGVSCTPMETIGGARLCEVVLDSVEVPSENIVGTAGQSWPVVEKILHLAALAKCAEMVGGCDRVLEMTISYAKQRIQFDKPIGSFQAIQHYCANMAIDADAARLLTYQAAWRVSKGIPYLREAALAKAWVSEAYKRVTLFGHKIHGGVGLIVDHDLPLYSKKAITGRVLFGSPDFYKESIIREMKLRGI